MSIVTEEEWLREIKKMMTGQVIDADAPVNALKGLLESGKEKKGGIWCSAITEAIRCVSAALRTDTVILHRLLLFEERVAKCKSMITDYETEHGNIVPGITDEDIENIVELFCENYDGEVAENALWLNSISEYLSELRPLDQAC